MSADCLGVGRFPVARLKRRALLRCGAPGGSSMPLNEPVLVTQCSLDRLPALLEQAAAWRGPLVAAVLCHDGVAAVSLGAARVALEAALQTVAGERAGELQVALLEEVPTRGALSGGALSGLYPINALRNAALELAAGEVVLQLDVDFVPSEGLYEATRQPALYAAVRRACLEERKMLVLPAFESCEEPCAAAQLAAGGKAQLRAAVAGGRARVFASDGRCAFAAGHRATDSQRWLGSDAAYTVSHEEGYEPYGLCARQLPPPWDARFRGYGRNKIVQLWCLARLGFRFEVQPEHFIVHRRRVF